MIKSILKIVPQWTIAYLLLCTHIHAQTDCARLPRYSAGQTNEHRNNFWVDADYLFWKIQNSPEPVPLVIQTPQSVMPLPVLGAPFSSIALGGKKIDTGGRSGARFALGYWFDCDHRYSMEANYFFLPKESKKCSIRSNGSPSSSLLLVPYFNVVTFAPDSIAIASPFYSIAGSATLKLTNAMQGAELNALATIPSCYCRSTFTALAGFRYWNFKEHLTFSTNGHFNPPHVSDTYSTKDAFCTKNNFYGGQLGAIWEYDYDRLLITAKGKIALGAMRESVRINGYLLTNDYTNFGAVVQYPGGYFALPTNIGKCSQTKFAALPEVNFSASYQLFDCMQLSLGYTFMYASNVLWAGKQINSDINPTQSVSYTGAVPPLLQGNASPMACLKTKSLWVQGLNIGAQFHF